MQVSPRAAWDRFLELVGEDGQGILTVPTDSFREQLDPFLTNPEAHREHVRLIVRATQLASALRILTNMPLGLGLTYRTILRRSGRKPLAEFRKEVQELRDRLREETAPGDVSLDILPLKLSETAAEYRRSGLQAYLAEVRLAVYPRHDLKPETVRLRLELGAEAASAFRFIDWKPRTDFTELLSHEAQQSVATKTVDSEKLSSEVSAGLEKGPVKVGSKASGEVSSTFEASASNADKLTYQTTLPKVISDAVGTRARWEFFHTNTYIPIGGTECSAVILGPSSVESIGMSLVASVVVPGWGELSLREARTLTLPRFEPT